MKITFFWLSMGGRAQPLAPIDIDRALMTVLAESGAADKLRAGAMAAADDAYTENREVAGDLHERGKDAINEVLSGDTETATSRHDSP